MHARGHSVTFAAGREPPVNGFWSLTLYNDKHLIHPNALDRCWVGTRNRNLKRNDDGSLTVYVGATSPGPDNESKWLPAPDDDFPLSIRACWSKEGITGGSWRSPPIERT